MMRLRNEFTSRRFSSVRHPLFIESILSRSKPHDTNANQFLQDALIGEAHEKAEFCFGTLLSKGDTTQ